MGRQNSEPFRWFGSSFFDEPFFSRPFFNDPFKWSGGFFGGWFSSPWWGPNASSSQQEAPTFSAESSAEGGDFSYTCRTTTGGIGEPSVVHTVSAQGSAADGMHMRETVWDARSGETTVVREVSCSSNIQTHFGIGDKPAQQGVRRLENKHGSFAGITPPS